MNTLIRFEDSYGMADIFCACNGYKYLGIPQSSSVHNLGQQGTLYIENGLGSSCIDFDDDGLARIAALNIDRIVAVMDVDAPNNRDLIITKEELCKNMCQAKDKISEFSKSMQLEYVVTFYTTETIMLYQALYNRGVDTSYPEKVIYNGDIRTFTACMLSYLYNVRNPSRAKHARDILNLTLLKKNMQYALQNNPIRLNEHIFNWVLSGCKEPVKHLTDSDVLKLMDDANEVIQAERYKLKEIMLQRNSEHIIIRSDIKTRDFRLLLKNKCKGGINNEINQH